MQEWKKNEYIKMTISIMAIPDWLDRYMISELPMWPCSNQ